MGSGKNYFSFIWVLSFGVFILSRHYIFGRELQKEIACYNNALHLSCGANNFIAIHEAYFTTEPQENQTCHLPTPEHEYIEDETMEVGSSNLSTCYEDIRISINKVCSGLRNCTYSYYDRPEKQCHIIGGQFIVRYDCVKGANLNKFCNIKVQAREGYIASPGFPGFYPKLDSCSWSIEGSSGQTILVKILHLHTSPATEVYPTVADSDLYVPAILGLLMSGEETSRCEHDSLSIFEGGVKRAVVCGEQVQSLRTIVGEADSGMTIMFETAKLMPASGFLAYFKVQGCPTMKPSEGSYLVERNGSAAIYSCLRHQVFNDTLENTRFLRCVRDHHWNDTLPPCIAYEEPTTVTIPSKSIEMEDEVVNVTNVTTTAMTMANIMVEKAGYIEDILIPSILIGVLVVGNAIIVTIICIIRKKQKKNLEDDGEELKDEPKSQPLVSEINDV